MSNMQGNEQRQVSSDACWVVTDGIAGMENQCLGLAEAMGLTPVVKRVRIRTPWKQLSPFLRFGLSLAVSRKGDAIEPPWPRLLISCGRQSIPASLYVRRASGKKTLTVHIQNPVIDPSRFGLVIVPRHDGLAGPNVMTTRGSLHRITPEMLSKEAAKLQPKLEHLGKSKIAVLIGGPNSVFSMSAREMKSIAEQLAGIASRGASLMITASRRTGCENVDILKEALKGIPCFFWDGQGPNPYFGMLGLADAIIVTCDSVNMISEACSTGKPVMIIDLPGGSDKFRRFHQAMRDDGMIRPFKGEIERWSYTPLNDMRLAAERVKQMMDSNER